MQLKCTKYLDVKQQLGIKQNPNEKVKMFNSIGVDLYMPKATNKFIDEFIKQNSTEQNQLHVGEVEFDENDKITNFTIYDIVNRIIVQFSNNTFTFFKNCQIPNGVALLIPDDYHVDLRPRSSNHKNNYMTTLGLIDCDYTMQLATQLKLFSHAISIKEDERFAQIILIKSEKINVIECLENSDFESLEEVKLRRLNRIDGFGSTGKF